MNEEIQTLFRWQCWQDYLELDCRMKNAKKPQIEQIFAPLISFTSC